MTLAARKTFLIRILESYLIARFRRKIIQRSGHMNRKLIFMNEITWTFLTPNLTVLLNFQHFQDFKYKTKIFIEDSYCSCKSRVPNISINGLGLTLFSLFMGQRFDLKSTPTTSKWSVPEFSIKIFNQLSPDHRSKFQMK